MDIQHRHIEVFRAVMTAGSVTAAAALLHTSQPTLSRDLARLEQLLGYALFCGFRQVAGWRGLLFAVQSPHAQPDALFEHLRTFLEDAAISLGELPDARLHDLAHSLANEPANENAAWRDQLAGVDAGHAQRVAEAARHTARADLLAAHAALLDEQGGCWLLTHRA